MSTAEINAEKALLGAALLRPELWDATARSVRAEDFSLESNRRIFSRMSALAESGEGVDLVTVVAELDRQKELHAVGDAAYVASLMDGVPDYSLSVASYAKLIKKAALTRKLVKAAELAIERAEHGEPVATIAHGLVESCIEVESEQQGSREFTPREFMPEVIEELQAQAHAGGLIGLPTGIFPLDELTGGYRKGELIVIGALPGAGKTAAALQTLAANAQAGNGVGFFSLEMSRWDIGRRFLPIVTPVSASKIRKPSFIAKADWQTLADGAAELSGWPLIVDDSGSLHISDLISRARLFIKRHGVELIVVDYLQLVRADARDIRERVSKVADALRQLAKAEQVPVVLLSQLRRPQNVNDVPTLIDLKESGDIESHAHVVLLLHVPTGPDGPTGEDTLIVAKNRNGSRGPIPLMFSPHKLQFYPREVNS